MVLLILAVIWAAVLLPPALQSRRENRPGDSIASFRSQLRVLERTTPGFGPRPIRRAPRSSAPQALPVRQTRVTGHAPVARSAAYARRAEARRRRRDIFVTLLGAVALTLAAALVMGGPVWGLHFAVLALFVGYVALLIYMQHQVAEREMKVRFLHERRPARAVDPAVLRRSATN